MLLSLNLQIISKRVHDSQMTKEELIVHRDFIVESFNTIDVPLIKLFVKNFQVPIIICISFFVIFQFIKFFRQSSKFWVKIYF